MIIFVEGIDKSGKDTIVQYINEYTGFQHYVSARGPMSVMAYGKKFNRKVDDFKYLEKIRDEVFILHLTVDKSDFNIRCKITNEPHTNYEQDVELFDDAYIYFDSLGFRILRVNTSQFTPQQIAETVREIVRRPHEKRKHTED